jgi:hypothetical protein
MDRRSIAADGTKTPHRHLWVEVCALNNYRECQANAAECARMARTAIGPVDKALWLEMAEHWIYLSPPSPVADDPRKGR